MRYILSVFATTFLFLSSVASAVEIDFVLISPPLASASNEYLLRVNDCSRIK
mgnify:FL=1